MTRSIFAFIIVLGTLFFFQCNSTSTNTTKNEQTKDSLIVNEDSVKVVSTSTKSEITCPKCGHKKMEEIPTDVCLLSYTCEKCNAVLHPKEGDCCVFCTYGTHKCPSIQEVSQ